MFAEDRKAKGYSNFVKYSELIRKSLSKELPRSILGYSRKSLLLRLCQQLTMDGLSGFMSKLDAEGEYSNSAKFIDFGIYAFNLESKSLSLSCKFFFKTFISFMALWVVTLFVFLASFIFGKNKNVKAVIIYGVPLELSDKNTLKNFESFCLNQTELPFSNDIHYIVQTNQRCISTGNIRYSKYPILSLLADSRFKFSDFIFFLREHFLVFFLFFVHSLRVNGISILWRDFALHPAIKLLNRKKILTAFLLTNTSWYRQYIWMSNLHNRRFRTYMIPYSMNFSPLAYKNNNNIYGPHPSLGQLRVDEIWVWSSGDVLELSKLGVLAPAVIKKPILWYPDFEVPLDRSSKFSVLIFDVTPMTLERLAITGVRENYYSSKTMENFVEDILEICFQLSREFAFEINVGLKPKRNYSESHDHDYIKFLNEMVDKNRLKILSPRENLFSIIRSSDLVISIPFSSPTYVAQAIGKNAIFYDP